jgi:hypothetical protein
MMSHLHLKCAKHMFLVILSILFIMTGCMQLLGFVCTSSRLLQVITFDLGFSWLFYSIIDLEMAWTYQLVSMFIELHRVITGISIWTFVLSDFDHLMVPPLKLRTWSTDVLCITLANPFILDLMQKHAFMHTFIDIYIHDTEAWIRVRSHRRPKFGRRLRLHEANDRS